MPRSQTIFESLIRLLDHSGRPIYVVDAQRRLVYCNAALASWIELESKRIVGRRVEFHSEEPKHEDPSRPEVTPLTDLCPPPRAMAGETVYGTISCQARDGHMRHRTAQFVPFSQAPTSKRDGDGNIPHVAVLVLLDEADLSPQQLAAQVTGESTDELHRTIRQFRRGQAQRYSIKSLLGSSTAMQKVRAQVAAAGSSGANVLIVGPRGSGRLHVALAIHYQDVGEAQTRLLPINCEVVTDDLWQRALEKLKPSPRSQEARPTLLLENLESLSPAHAQILAAALQTASIDARIIATMAPGKSIEVDRNLGSVYEQPSEVNVERQPRATEDAPFTIDASLFNAISTITIRIPRLVDRLDDLPLIAQYFVEACNRGSGKQVESLRSDALESLALYSWPGELDQLRQMIEAAHESCGSYQITAADLPTTLFHSSRAAARIRPEPERIVLDDLLASIEKEAIVRALAVSGGNKSEAAALLGMTRPRLYRRLVQLGLTHGEATDVAADAEMPEFIETEHAE